MPVAAFDAPLRVTGPGCAGRHGRGPRGGGHCAHAAGPEHYRGGHRGGAMYLPAHAGEGRVHGCWPTGGCLEGRWLYVSACGPGRAGEAGQASLQLELPQPSHLDLLAPHAPRTSSTTAWPPRCSCSPSSSSPSSPSRPRATSRRVRRSRPHSPTLWEHHSLHCSYLPPLHTRVPGPCRRAVAELLSWVVCLCTVVGGTPMYFQPCSHTRSVSPVPTVPVWPITGTCCVRAP
jgi:hypothetical protein